MARRSFNPVELDYLRGQATGVAAFVVDDIASTDPWIVRGVEVRGHAQAVTDAEPQMAGMSREVIRITPDLIRSWGLQGDDDG
jgi:pyridoxamine 5'-phosphate oxidase family protein